MCGNLSGRKILAVEDEHLIAMDLQDILESWGCTVIGPVATSQAALDLIKTDLPDAAVLDVNLNGETSEPIADALRSGGCPFLVMTAYNADHLSGALAGAPLLNKPVDERKLRHELSTLLADQSTS